MNRTLACCLMSAVFAFPALAQDQPAMEVEAPVPVESETPAPAPGSDNTGATAAEPSAEDVANSLKEQIQENPLIEPTRADPANTGTGTTETPSGADQPVPAQAAVPSGLRQVDPRIVGVAPGAEPPTLRREGEFVVGRRGRLIRSAGAASVMFAFEADGENTPEPPMILIPCQMLQNMEDLVQERGDKLVFVLSGQVMTYRGANYLLPTMMKLAVDRGNLQN